MARRRFKRAGFNQKLIMDVGLAGLGVRILPMVVNKFVPLDQTLWSVVGAGGTYVVGSMLKKPDLANAAIALGIVELAAPMVENLIGGFVGTPAISVSPVPPYHREIKGAPVAISDYINLNDYIDTPGVRQSVDAYRSSY